MEMKGCERGLKNERLGDNKADAEEGENREAGEMLRLILNPPSLISVDKMRVSFQGNNKLNLLEPP